MDMECSLGSAEVHIVPAAPAPGDRVAGRDNQQAARGGNDASGRAQSTFAPESLTTFAHFVVSLRMYSTKNSGELPTASAPWARSFSFMSPACSALFTSALM